MNESVATTLAWRDCWLTTASWRLGLSCTSLGDTWRAAGSHWCVSEGSAKKSEVLLLALGARLHEDMINHFACTLCAYLRGLGLQARGDDPRDACSSKIVPYTDRHPYNRWNNMGWVDQLAPCKVYEIKSTNPSTSWKLDVQERHFVWVWVVKDDSVLSSSR